MRKILRIITVAFLAFLFISSLISIYSLYDLNAKNIIRSFDIRTPIVYGSLSLLSLLFNVSKLFTYKIYTKKVYNFLRLGDFAFIISAFVYLIFSVFQFIVKSISYANSSKQILILPIVLFFIIFCIVLFFDNLKYQKEIEDREQLKMQNFIDEIGIEKR